MLDLDRWQEVLLTLRHNKLRAVLTASGVAWGVFMLVLMLGFGAGLERGVRSNMVGFTANSVFMWGQRTSMPHAGFLPGRYVGFMTEDIKAIEEGVIGMKALAPRIQLGGWQDGNNITNGSKTGNFGVMGDYPQLAEIEGLELVFGRFLNARDIQERRKVAVLGEHVRSVLFGDDKAPLGRYVKVRGVQFQVIGIFESRQPGEQGEKGNATVHIPFSTFQIAFNGKNRVGWFAVVADDHASAETLEHDVREVLKKQHKVHPDDDQAVGAYNAAQKFGKVQSLFTGVRFFTWFVSIATLLAGALGVSNIMLISVKERKREFGVRKALGATPRSIVALVMQEALLLTTLAGYIGLLTGVFGLELLGEVLADTGGPLGRPSIDVRAALGAFAALCVTGVLAGLAPAQHAAKIRPVVALRAE
jgi:putative ABC transport system permease protein